MQLLWISAAVLIALLIATFTALAIRCRRRYRAGDGNALKKLPLYLVAVFILLVLAAILWVVHSVWVSCGSP